MAYIGKEPASGIRNRFIFTATAGQTTFSGADDDSRTLNYTDGHFTDVFLNGVKLDKSDYTATSGTSIVLSEAASVNDILEVVAYDTISFFDGDFSQDLTVGGTLTVNGTVDVNGNELILDADGDTSITADTDDEIDFRLAGEDRMTIGALGIDINGRASDDRAYIQLKENDGTTFAQLLTIPNSNFVRLNATTGNEIDFSINAASKMRIDSSGNLLVGGDTFDNGAFSGSANGINVFDNFPIVNLVETGGNTSFYMGKTSSLNYFGTADAQDIIFITNDTTRMRLLSGGGLAFNSDTAAANALDDYEEGTWTPTLTSNGTAPTITSYSNRVGRYTKVGDMLYVTCFIRAILSAAGTGTPRVSGFPFNTESGVYQPVYTGLITILNNGTDSQPYSISGNYVQFDGGTSFNADGGNRYLCFSAVFKV